MGASEWLTSERLGWFHCLKSLFVASYGEAESKLPAGGESTNGRETKSLEEA